SFARTAVGSVVQNHFRTLLTFLSLENPSRGDVHHCDFIHAAASQVQLAIRSSDHIAHYAAARGNHLRAEALGFGIKSDEGVRFYPGLAVPDLAIAGGRDTVRVRLRPARRCPLLQQLSSRGVEVTQVTARIIGVIDRAIRGQCESPWPRTQR